MNIEIIVPKINSLILNIENNYIRAKKINRGDFLITNILMFTKFQLIETNKLDDNITVSLVTLASRESHYYYFNDFPDLYLEFQEVYNLLAASGLNERFLDADSKIIKMENKYWLHHFDQIISSILNASR